MDYLPSIWRNMARPVLIVILLITLSCPAAFAQEGVNEELSQASGTDTLHVFKKVKQVLKLGRM